MQVCDSGREVQKDQAFEMIQQLKQEVRPEAFKAVWTKLQAWEFDFRGLVLDGVPVVDSRRMVELRTTKPSQTLGWEKAAEKTAEDFDLRRKQPEKAEIQEAQEKASPEASASARPQAEGPQQKSDVPKKQPEKAEGRKIIKSEGAPKSHEGPK